MSARVNGQLSARNELLKAEDSAMGNVAHAAEKGDVAASIAVIEYCLKQQF